MLNFLDGTHLDNDAIKENHNFGVLDKWTEIFVYQIQLFNPYAIDDLSVIPVKKKYDFQTKNIPLLPSISSRQNRCFQRYDCGAYRRF